jgi:DNA-binding response OmpR family regulator
MIEGRILLFGDNPKTTRRLKKTLEKETFTFFYVKEKIDVGRRILEFEPELIILNFSSSPEDNYKICQEIKKDKEFKNIPVIIITNNSKRELITALEIGADDCLAEPIDYDIFLARVRAILRRISYREEPEEILWCKDIVTNLTTKTFQTVERVGYMFRT